MSFRTWLVSLFKKEDSKIVESLSDAAVKKIESGVKSTVVEMVGRQNRADQAAQIISYNMRNRLNYDAPTRHRIERKDPLECNHLKGGSLKTPYKDYAVLTHTFPDSVTRIWCMICGKRWTKESPDWKQAWDMVRNSTNIPSSSEVSLKRA